MSLARVLDESDRRQVAAVPEGYAEKAMASLMQLHAELMEEKERRVELYRRLLDREQQLAELRMYVGMLEERARGAEGSPPLPVAPAAATSGGPRTPPLRPPVPPRVAPRSRIEGWRAW
jgi:hypothetical protein